MARKLRIAVSVFFGLLTVALVVVWWASYWTCYKVYHYGVPSVMIAANEGIALIASAGHGATPNAWDYHQQAATSTPAKYRRVGVVDDKMITVPFWILATLTTAAALAPAIPNRFSLRALLIATTLVAVVLGLVVWVGR